MLTYLPTCDNVDTGGRICRKEYMLGQWNINVILGTLLKGKGARQSNAKEWVKHVKESQVRKRGNIFRSIKGQMLHIGKAGDHIVLLVENLSHMELFIARNIILG